MLRIFLMITLTAVVFQVVAAPVTFKDKGDFDTAISNISGITANVIDFDSTLGGTLIPNDSIFQGVTFSSNLPAIGFGLAVNNIGSISGANSLGAVDTSVPDPIVLQFGLGDEITFDFAASHAFGLYIVVETSFPFFDGDVNLTFAGETLSNLATDINLVDTFTGGEALWLGIVDDTVTFTTATLRFGPSGPINFISVGELDNITRTVASPPATPISEPLMILLLGIGTFILFGFTRRRRSV